MNTTGRGMELASFKAPATLEASALDLSQRLGAVKMLRAADEPDFGSGEFLHMFPFRKTLSRIFACLILVVAERSQVPRAQQSIQGPLNPVLPATTPEQSLLNVHNENTSSTIPRVSLSALRRRSNGAKYYFDKRDRLHPNLSRCWTWRMPDAKNRYTDLGSLSNEIYISFR